MNSDKASPKASPDANDQIQVSPYVPRQLIVTLMEVDGGNDAQKALQKILEVRVLRTKIKAVESHNGGIFNDVQKDYSQEFVVREQYNKQIYTALRRYRESGLPIKILMFEPDPTHTKVIDAWMIENGKIGFVRTSSFPYRDVNTIQVPLAEGDAPFPGTAAQINTTFTIFGDLHHELSIIDLAQMVFDEMNQAGKNPIRQFEPAA